MKNLVSSLIVAVSLLTLAVNLHSQSALPKSPADQLKVLNAKNAEIIARQKQTLLKLDEMDKQAEQIRFLAKRS